MLLNLVRAAEQLAERRETLMHLIFFTGLMNQYDIIPNADICGLVTIVLSQHKWSI